MRVTVSSTRFLRLMDKYVVTFDEMLTKEKERGAEMMKKNHNPGQASCSSEQGFNETLTDAGVSEELFEQHVNSDAEVQAVPSLNPPSGSVDVNENAYSSVSGAAQVNPSQVKNCSIIDAAVIDPSNGFSVVVDNWDMRQEVRHMTADHQNTDIHWVNHNLVENRVSGNHLPDDGPIKDILDVENKDLIPSIADHKEMYNNYLVHIQRILTKRIPALQCLSDHVPKHIKHKHSHEMSMKSKKVILSKITYKLAMVFTF